MNSMQIVLDGRFPEAALESKGRWWIRSDQCLTFRS
jgi:hypothetical protein